jgi:hypothetical protein
MLSISLEVSLKILFLNRVYSQAVGVPGMDYLGTLSASEAAVWECATTPNHGLSIWKQLLPAGEMALSPEQEV